MKVKNKKAVFICQVTDNALKAIKCVKNKFVNLELEKIPPDIEDEKLSQNLSRLFSKAGYTHNPLIVSLLRNQAVCRYIKIPAQAPQEIEKIVSLQAPKYLPYPANTLVTAYQVIATDKEGNSYINLVIAHKDAVSRYLYIFKGLKPAKITILLSSYGLCNLYRYLRPQDLSPTLLIDIDAHQAELAIISRKKLLFSRYFKIDTLKAGWENTFIEEIRKTHEAYLKEVSQEIPDKIIVISAGKVPAGFSRSLKEKSTLPVEALSYIDEIKITGDLAGIISSGEFSFSSLLGLGLLDTEESLNLVMPGMKEEAKKVSSRRECLKIISLAAAAVFIFGLGAFKNLSDKAAYLKDLNLQLDKITQEARPLERLEKRFDILSARLAKKPSSPQIISELYKITPEQVSLVNFSYEEDKQMVMRGQAPEINSVVAFNRALEKSSVFKNFDIGIRFTTTRRTADGEIIDFEIVCNKK